MIQEKASKPHFEKALIYIVKCHWAFNGSPGQEENIFTCFSDAQAHLLADLEENKKSGHVADWKDNPRFMEEQSPRSYECYLDDEYCENHYSILVEEVPLALSPEFIHRVTTIAADNIPTLAERDHMLESLWASIEDIPMDPDTECYEAPVLGFPEGTHREDIWQWFDNRHSRGVAYLLYSQDIPREKELKTYQPLLDRLCPECLAELCCYNPSGRCLIPIAYGRSPRLNDDGCQDFCYKGDDL